MFEKYIAVFYLVYFYYPFWELLWVFLWSKIRFQGWGWNLEDGAYRM